MSGDRLDRLMDQFLFAPSKELELAPESVRAFAVEQAAGSGQQQSAPLPKQQAVASNMASTWTTWVNISLPVTIDAASVNAHATEAAQLAKQRLVVDAEDEEVVGVALRSRMRPPMHPRQCHRQKHQQR